MLVLQDCNLVVIDAYHCSRTRGSKLPLPMANIDTNCMTLTRFVLQEQKKFPHASGDLTMLLQSLLTAIKVVQTAVRRAGISDL